MRSSSRTLMAGTAGIAVIAALTIGITAMQTGTTPATPSTVTGSPSPDTVTGITDPVTESTGPGSQVIAPDPSLATQNAARNHSMGSTLETFDPDFPRSKKQTQTLSVIGGPPGIDGLDVSGWQVLSTADWSRIASQGAKFAYVKATEDTDYVSSQFASQYAGSYNAGLLHGAYHFATPNTSTGAAQANWFLDHGGQGTSDGRTMPPLLDIEYNPYGPTCYGLSQAAMVNWIADFSNTVRLRTGRLPAIYSTTNWWITCTGNSSAFSASPLFIARYPSNLSDGAGTLPAGWSTYTLWQYGSTGVFPGDQDVFNGSALELQTFGLSSSLIRTVANPSVYLVSGSTKYPVTNQDMLQALSPLGSVAYVGQSYLDQFRTAQAASRIIRGPDGSIYFFDSGIKLPITSCSLVSDYGGSCDSTGYVQLNAQQAARFVTGPYATPLITSAGGPLYQIAGGSKHEVLDSTSLSQAGINAGVNSLSAGAVGYLPFGQPVVRNDAVVSLRGGSGGVILTGGKASPIDPSAATLAVTSKAAGSLSSQSIALLPAGAPFTGAFKSAQDGSISVVAGDGIHTWPAGVGGASFATLTVPAAILGLYPTAAPIQAGTAIMSASGGTVYLVMPNDIRPISSWNALLALSAGKTPTITTVPQSVIASLPVGPVALESGTLVRNVSSATVYLVNGVTNKIPFSTFDPATEAGFTSFTFTSDDRLAAYPTSSTLLNFGVQCGTTKYVSAGGSIHALSATTAPLYPFTTVQLDQFTCGLVKKGIDATAFIRTPDGSIYYLNGDGKKHPVSSMARFAQLAGGQTYLDVAASFGAAFPTGAAA
ncbi:lysozyme [Leifsonia soli]|uniref:lysozyme n=1 Tax=Leifsonia soli TaxID=582665 RepID=A0A852SV78_9MICO|nr:lysozyme [Leifsonia soli]NYD72625.1 GH25 family lysozyme M1 (1,4-beta-N-acetylmuramidase) [Leifsonia soli]